MNIQELFRASAVSDERFERFNTFDPDRFDYTVQVQKPDGEIVTLRNPNEAKDGSLTARHHAVPTGSKLIAAGTAFWEWPDKKQHTVGIDIDTDDTHAKGLTGSAIAIALEATGRVPWMDVRRSSGGKGLHVFPRFTQPVEVSCRAEASALARAVLTAASREASFDFKAAKDCAGSNFWIYKADAALNAYELIKEATAALDPEQLPPGWRHAKEASKRKIQFAPSTVDLSPEHLEIEKQIQSFNYSMIYIPDIGCYHIHTHALQEAYRKFAYRGYFATTSEGNNPGQPNGYMFPLPDGGFLVKRFGNAKEDNSWFDGPNGPYTLLNIAVPFKRAVQRFSVNKTTKGYVFTRLNLDLMLKVAGVSLEIPEAFANRTFFLKLVKDDAQLSVEKHGSDDLVSDWTASGQTWQRSFPIPQISGAFTQADVVQVSDKIRAISTEKESAKWCIKTDGEWVGTSASEISNVLVSHNVSPSAAMGCMREKPYWLVFEPFQSEYLPGRRWNREAPQLACNPAEVAGETPTWDAIFRHIGSGLDDDVTNDEDCKSRGITSGSGYLRIWVKLLIEKPQQRLPYLFLTSRENNTGKTSLGASVRNLIDPGVAEINEEALVDKFTGELEGPVLCLIEELDLRDKRNKAYSTLKRVLTSKTLTIRKMRTDAYNVPNYTHFIHTANGADFVPCETEDVRIVMIKVPPITHFIESIEFEEGIKREAPSMLRKLLDMPLPNPCGRFWLPVVQTSLKESVVSGLYSEEISDAEESLRLFTSKFITQALEGAAPVPEVLSRYETFCKESGLRKVSKMGVLKTLRDKFGMNIDRKQIRVGGKQVWHYTGMNLKA